MKYTIDRVNPSSVARVVSVTAAFLFVLVFLGTLLVSVLFADTGEPGFSIDASNVGFITIVLPFIYMVGVYISSYIAALAFNAATRLAGGIRLELSDR